MIFFRYFLIQLFTYIIDIGIFLLIFKIGLLGPLTCNISGKLTAGLFAFLWHRKFTFKSDDSENKASQAIRYFILLSFSVPMSSTILAIFLMFVNDPIISKILSDIMGVILTFWLSKSFVFDKKASIDSSSVDFTDNNT